MISMTVSIYFHSGSCGPMGGSVTYGIDLSIKVFPDKKSPNRK